MRKEHTGIQGSTHQHIGQSRRFSLVCCLSIIIVVTIKGFCGILNLGLFVPVCTYKKIKQNCLHQNINAKEEFKNEYHTRYIPVQTTFKSKPF